MARRSTGKLVTTGRTVPIRGAINKMVSTSCIARLLVMAAEDQQSPIVAYIDSPAGRSQPRMAETMSLNSRMYCRYSCGLPA